MLLVQFIRNRLTLIVKVFLGIPSGSISGHLLCSCEAILLRGNHFVLVDCHSAAAEIPNLPPGYMIGLITTASGHRA